jgi:DNA (cytosine-5)-methyltransferase 1
MTYVLLDLFCGAGGAAKGYHDAGLDVMGIDKEPQPHYPFPFVQADALEALKAVISGEILGVNAIHASPPCQAYSSLRHVHPDTDQKYPKLVEPLRFLLRRAGVPYVIENVEGAPLENPVILCGSHFGLSTYWEGRGTVGLKRHRLFETNWPLPDPGPHDHSLPAMPVYGHGGKSRGCLIGWGKGGAQACREVMGIDWMTRDELNEAIPPAYTQYVGAHLMQYLESEAA